MFIKNVFRIFTLKTAYKFPSPMKLIKPIFLAAAAGIYYVNNCSSQKQNFQVPQKIRKKAQENKIVLVLDLDETLVYSRSPIKPTNHNNYITAKYIDGSQLVIQLRPHIYRFLAATSSIFTIYIYTAGIKSYADIVIDAIDHEKVIKKRFYRESCVKHNRSYVKILGKIRSVEQKGRRMVLVDDNEISIELNSPQSIYILPFEGDQLDQELITTFDKLLKLYE